MATDPRLGWLDKRASSSLKATKSLNTSSDAQLSRIFAFFQRVDRRVLFLWLEDGNDGDVNADWFPPSLLHTVKLLAIRKRSTVAHLDPGTLDSSTVIAELMSSAWAQCEALCYHVYLPMLGALQPDNIDGHGQAGDSKRALDAYHRFLGTMQASNGRYRVVSSPNLLSPRYCWSEIDCKAVVCPTPL